MDEEKRQRRIMELTEYCIKNRIYDAPTIADLAIAFYSVSTQEARELAEIVQKRIVYRGLTRPVAL